MIARLIRRAMGRGSARTSSLSQAAQLEEPVNPRIVRNTNTVATLSIVAFFAWAAVTNVNEVAHTRGEIVPQGFAQTIQHLEGGMVAEIQTREGNIVEAGDPLIRLSDTTLRNERRSIRATLRTHRLEAERLRAFVDDRAIDLSDFMLANRKVLQDTIATFNAMKAARRREESVVVEQIRQRQKKLKSLQASVNVAASNIALYERLHTIRSQLHAVGLVSLVLLLETQARLNEALGEKERLDTELRIARDEITEYQERREALVLRHRDDATQRLSRVLAAIEQEEAALERIDERIARLVLRAPTRGLVKGLSVNTIGAVIQPG
ncbi:MAG: TolC family protein, partial [Pseudomonadota bacterium]